MAIFIVVLHTDAFQYFYGNRNVFNIEYSHYFGEYLVTTFFVISGFLITFLLLKEYHNYSKINISKFYMRRILRIWPLYYTVIIFSFAIGPHFEIFNSPLVSPNAFSNYFEKLIQFLLFAANLPILIYNPEGSFNFIPVPPIVAQSWTIGVEEQFYLVWPIIILFAKKSIKPIIIFFLLMLSIKALVQIGLILFQNEYLTLFKRINYFIYLSRFGCISVGAIGAYIFVFYRNILHKYIFNKKTEIIAYVICLSMLIFIFRAPFLNQEIFSICIAIALLNISCNPNTSLHLEYKWINYLGKISYGIYMYHMIIIVVVANVSFNFWNENNSFLIGIINHTVVMALTIVISVLSFEFMESKFLDLKSRFTPNYSKK